MDCPRTTLFIKNKDIGFEKDNIVAIDVPMDSLVLTNLNAFMERLRTIPAFSVH